MDSPRLRGMTALATIVKQFRFEAAHQLPNHGGQCRDLHGHSYLVEVAVAGPVNPVRGLSDDGMVVDFGDIKIAFRERVHDRCDHHFLNDVLPVPVTTAENIAGWILGEMDDALDGRVKWVRVWETASGYAQVDAVDAMGVSQSEMRMSRTW